MVKSDTVRVALIGDGKVAHLHAQALQTIPGAKLVAVCGVQPERVQTFAQTYQLQPYLNIQDMIRKEAVDVAIICTPHPVHAAASIEAVEAGAHVLVEKPMAASLRDCDAMIAAADASGVKLGMVSQRRLYAPAQRMRKAIDNGKIGKPVLGMVLMLGWRDGSYYQSDPWRGKWHTEGGGVLVNQAPHQLDLFQWYMGPIDELVGYWDNLNHPYIEVEDTAVAVLRFKNGGLGNVIVSNSQKPGIYGKVHIHGENGASVGVQTDGGAMFIAGMSSILEPPMNDLWTVPGEEHLLADWQEEDRQLFDRIDPTIYFHRLQDMDFIQSIVDNRDPLVTGREGRITVEIFSAIYRSQRDKSAIKFPLDAEADDHDFDGRLVKPSYGRG